MLTIRGRLRFAALILALLSSVSAGAQETPTGISGRVTTEDGSLFPQARVRVVDRATKKSVTAVTDGDGEYSLQLPPATYDVFVEAESWKPGRRKGLKVVRGVRLIVDVVLSPGKAVVVDADHP